MALPEPPPTEKERAAICEWLTANGIAPKAVPLQCRLAVSNGTIRFEEYVLTADGQKQVNPSDGVEPWTKPATTPCRVKPPAWLKVPGGPQ